MENNLNNLLDLNQSSLEALQTLPGIGLVLAERIIAARPFTSVEDLRRVEGVNESTLEHLRPLISVSPPGEEAAEQPSLNEPASAQAAEAQPAALQEPVDMGSEAVPGKEGAELVGEGAPEAIPEEEMPAEAVGEPVPEDQPAQSIGEAVSEEMPSEAEAEAKITPEAVISPEAEVMPEAKLTPEAEVLPEAEIMPEDEKLPEGAVEPEQGEDELQEAGAPAYFDAAQELPPIGSVSQEEQTEPAQSQLREEPKPSLPVRQPRYITRGEAFWIAAGGAVVSAILATAFVVILFFVLNGSLHYARLSDQTRLRTQITGLQSDVSTLQSGLAEVQTGLQALQGLNDRVDTLEGDAAQNKTDLEALQSQFNDLNGKLGDLTKQVDDLGTQAAAINQQLDTLSGNVVDLQNLTQRFQNFFDGLRGLLDAMSQP